MGFSCRRPCAAQQKYRITGSGLTIYSLLKTDLPDTVKFNVALFQDILPFSNPHCQAVLNVNRKLFESASNF